MDIDKNLLDLLDGLYRSAVEPAIWEQTLDALLGMFRSQHAFLYTTKTAELTSPLLVTAGIDAVDRDRYLTLEADRAWAPISARIVSGVAAGIQDVIRPEALVSIFLGAPRPGTRPRAAELALAGAMMFRAGKYVR